MSNNLDKIALSPAILLKLVTSVQTHDTRLHVIAGAEKCAHPPRSVS